MTDKVNKATFEPYLNQTFEIDTDYFGIVEAELVEVNEKKYGEQVSISIVFAAPQDKVFNQKIYKVKHPEMGEMELFLVPITYGKQDRMYYETIFNYLDEKD